jgi:hypothetical protein
MSLWSNAISAGGCNNQVKRFIIFLVSLRELAEGDSSGDTVEDLLKEKDTLGHSHLQVQSCKKQRTEI